MEIGRLNCSADVLSNEGDNLMSSTNYRLVIGNLNTSSWSLRPWLAMTHFSIPFEEIRINLRASDRKARIFKHSPSGKVPALYHDDLMVWDSLAILEYLADRHPETPFWPSEPGARAIARSVSAEMHSGFLALRRHCPMKFLATQRMETFDDKVRLNIERIMVLWRDCRDRFGDNGPFLFSEFSIADAMYAPVASRLRTYVSDLAEFGDDGTAQAYMAALFAMPEMQQWGEAARAEQDAARQSAAS